MDLYNKIWNIFSSSNSNGDYYNLTKDGTSSISLSELSDELKILAETSFDELFNLKPKVKNKVIVHNKEVEVNRYYMSYLNVPEYNETEKKVICIVIKH
ncbi:MAG: hypothetical protein CMF62_01350 [Magnetococcales bacterium]|nr:hypothetical protein [Magnetococcales bacterium]MBA42640.1 hypothetical protein [Magnetococcales bacterium]